MKRFVDWINKVWGHDRYKGDNFGIRSLIHIPVGIIVALSSMVSWPIALIFAYWFVTYQKNEDGYYRDGAWVDLNGAMIGLAIGTVLVFFLQHH